MYSISYIITYFMIGAYTSWYMAGTICHVCSLSTFYDTIKWQYFRLFITCSFIACRLLDRSRAQTTTTKKASLKVNEIDVEQRATHDGDSPSLYTHFRQQNEKHAKQNKEEKMKKWQTANLLHIYSNKFSAEVCIIDPVTACRAVDANFMKKIKCFYFFDFCSSGARCYFFPRFSLS